MTVLQKLLSRPVRFWLGPIVLAALAAPVAAASPVHATGEQEVAGAAPASPIVVAQVTSVPLPRARPLMRAPSSDRPVTLPGGTPLDLLQGLDMNPDGNFETPLSDIARPSRQLEVTARLVEGGETLLDGLSWRIYRAQPAADGSFELVEESHNAAPVFSLPADDYIVHVAYGLANTASRVSLVDGPQQQALDLNAGGMRVSPLGELEEALSDRQVSLSIYSSEQDEYGQRKLLVEEAPAGKIIPLNAGTYHVVSRFGDANSVMRADIRVQPGQLTEATIMHRAAEVTLKLVNEQGGEALANTAWSILSPGGDVVKESYGAFPAHVLAAGEYSVVARHDGNLYSREFVVEPGRDSEVELIAR
ncbi:hypothetical protein ACFOHM_18330 [Microbaculum marinum]|uniref:Uncharacterized protein n=2 Tax=Microbaculum marinum TaxID=1764581 RepID=A0AAW9RZX2_9HYPH